MTDELFNSLMDLSFAMNRKEALKAAKKLYPETPPEELWEMLEDWPEEE